MTFLNHNGSSYCRELSKKNKTSYFITYHIVWSMSYIYIIMHLKLCHVVVIHLNRAQYLCDNNFVLLISNNLFFFSKFISLPFIIIFFLLHTTMTKNINKLNYCIHFSSYKIILYTSEQLFNLREATEFESFLIK